MQSRDTRFLLRIESGDRQGEQIPLPEGTLQVGRKTDCGLVLTDASVSGKHAEFRVLGATVQLVDLGSTNGTRVAGQKIEQASLGHGDTLLIGNVRMTLDDSSFAGAPPSAGSTPAFAPAATPDASALERVSTEMIKRAGARSRKLPLVLALVLALLIGGAVVALRLLGGSKPVGVAVTVPSVPGNLLADGSFEEGTSEWGAAESAPQAFLRDRSHAASGDVGLGVALEANGWSLARSPEVTLHARRRLEGVASVRVEGAALGRIGIELASSAGNLPAVIAWLPAQHAGGFAPATIAFDALGAYDRGRLVSAASGAGAVALDDVSLLEKDPAGDAAKFNEYELIVLGKDGSTAALARSGRVLLAGIDLSAWTRAGLAGWPEARLTARAGERGFTLAFPGAPAEAELRFSAVRPDAATSGGDAWVASTGAEGYAAHGGDFERTGVTSLLLGSGLELLRLGFARPVRVSSASGEGTLGFTIQLGGLEECEFQLTFVKERAEAVALETQAEEKQKRKDLGGALATWTELLDRFPFERARVARAEEARGNLIRTGLSEVEQVRRGLERARFFLLPELFRQERDEARRLAEQYRGSEVEAEAHKAAEECQMALGELSAGGRSGAAELLKGVLQALDPARAPHLSEHVKKSLDGVAQARSGD